MAFKSIFSYSDAATRALLLNNPVIINNLLIKAMGNGERGTEYLSLSMMASGHVLLQNSILRSNPIFIFINRSEDKK
jgi:hypothetical protein